MKHYSLITDPKFEPVADIIIAKCDYNKESHSTLNSWVKDVSNNGISISNIVTNNRFRNKDYKVTIETKKDIYCITVYKIAKKYSIIDLDNEAIDLNLDEDLIQII